MEATDAGPADDSPPATGAGPAHDTSPVSDAGQPKGAGPADDTVPPPGPTPADGPAGPPPGQHDPARRAFFLQFGKQAVTTVGQVAGMADIVGRTSSSAAASLLGLEQRRAAPAQPPFSRRGVEPASPATSVPAAEDAFRSPYRLLDDELIMLDQRGIPERLEEVAARRGSDVAYYLRIGVSRGGPRMAQEAAYGLALTAAERAAQPGAARSLELRRTRLALLQARPSARAVAWAMSRADAAIGAHEEAADGAAVAAALRRAADEVAGYFQAAHATIVALLAEHLPTAGDRPLAVLVHGDQGAMAGGLVGTGLAALRELRDRGRSLRIFVTEGRPFMDGARVASWELRQAGMAHQVIAEAAVPWLLLRETIDAVLIGAEWVAANGDTGAVIGSRAVAQAADATRRAGRGPVVIASGASAAIDPGTATGGDIPVDLRPGRELSAYLAEVPIRGSDALVPASDVIDASDLTVLVTERGVARPVSGETVAALCLPDAAAAPAGDG